MRFLILIAVALFAGRAGAAVSQHTVVSPDGSITVSIQVDDRIRYGMRVGDAEVMRDSTLSLTVDGRVLGVAPKLRSATPRSHDAMLEPVVRQKAAVVHERYNELRLEMDGGYAVTFRAYDEGLAYRWETALPKSQVTINAEEVGLRFTDNWFVYYPEEDGFYSHNERLFVPRALGDLSPHNLASIPAVVDTGRVKLAVADSDVVDYPGLWFRGTRGDGLDGVFPPRVLEEKLEGDRDLRVVRTADDIAITAGARVFPWRFVAVANNDGELLTNALPWLLQRPSELTDTSWIKPGKVAWDWYNANNLAGVDFKAGVNTETYRYYIDFAAQHGIEYVVLDEGWYVLGDMLKVAPGMDVPAIVAYGKERNVGIILWAIWKTLDDQLIPALDQFQKWGVKGIKVDFMQRDDQALIQYYERVTREAAKRKLLVDYHGGIRPAVMTRTWPNLISVEGVRGLEWNKWSAHITPEHTVTLPFTRMFLGPMDFTPGAMANATRAGFHDVFERPMSQGTRCHQLAMYVVFESPLQMLADSPTSYLREPACLEFLGAVPSVWDETRVLQARIGDYVVVARRSGKEWYIGAMTDWTPRELSIDLAFLGPGRFAIDEYRDGVNADRRSDDFKRVKRTVSKGDSLTLTLAPGGGWAARIRPE